MTPRINPTPVPLVADADGALRVAGTRVPLDIVVEAFLDGATAEEIAQRYPSVGLATVYAVVAYYLANRDEVDAYLTRRRAAAAVARGEWEAVGVVMRRSETAELRERLMARRDGRRASA